jgi:serine protease AprX
MATKSITSSTRRITRSITWRATATAGLATAVVLAGGQPTASASDTPATPAPTSATSAPSEGVPGSEGDAVGSADWGDIDPADEAAALTRAGAWSAARDANSLYSLEAAQGIHAAWAADMTGHDVTVAVIDTGVAPVEGLDGKEKVVDGPDLSFDGQSGTTPYVDGFGHGTHLAGIIAGEDEHWDRKKPNPAQFAGVAPEAQILNVKVGSADGGADVSQVIAAVDWVTQHRETDGMHVKVLALAYGTASVQPWQVDPLAAAVENAWKAGIVVVTAAGNDGLDAPSLLMPAVDPHVIAVGALDPMGTSDPGDDVVADFTNGGSAARRPDVLAPGRSLVSLRVPGSYADTMSPEGRVEGDESGRFFRGSGTSQATAFVAGQVALLLDKRPKLTPAQVKALLVGTARPLPGGNPAQGSGVVDIVAAATAAVPSASAVAGAAGAVWSTGSGSLEESRGGEHVVDPDTGVALTGEVDALGASWDAAGWYAASDAGSSWKKGVWNGRAWAGDKFEKKAWKLTSWSGDSWGGVPWSNRGQSEGQWEARSWRGNSWEARSWRADSWRARSWRGDSWRARSWRALF